MGRERLRADEPGGLVHGIAITTVQNGAESAVGAGKMTGIADACSGAS